MVKTFDDHYEVELHPEYRELIGNLLINFHFTVRGSSFRLEGNFEKMYPEFPEFITREGQRLTPRIIPSASS